MPSGNRNRKAIIAIIVLFFESIEGVSWAKLLFSRRLLLSLLMTRQTSWFYYQNNHHNDEYNDVFKKWDKV